MDQTLRVGPLGLGFAVTITAAVVVLVTAGRVAAWEGRALSLLAILFGAWVAIRASPWLSWPDVAASLALLLVAASISFRGSLTDLGIAEAIARTVHGLTHLLLGVQFGARPLRSLTPRLSRAAPLLRGLLIAVPILALVAGLLASADPVFASFFRINVDLGRLALDVVFFSVGSIVMAGVLRIAAAEPLGKIDGTSWRLGLTESLVVVAALDAVFAAFAVAQVVAVSGAGLQTLQNAGITYADYARSGFFQLLWVAGITLVVLAIFGRITAFGDGRGRLAFRALAGTGIVLTLLIVFVASRRLSLYEDAYGFTMLRLFSHIFAAWVAIVFLLLAADIGGVVSSRRWFVGAAGATALIVLLTINLINPEAIVVNQNTARAASTHKLDADYLASLSSDAIPALDTSRAELPADLAAKVDGILCGGARAYNPPWPALNLADAAAASTRHSVHC